MSSQLGGGRLGMDFDFFLGGGGGGHTLLHG